MSRYLGRSPLMIAASVAALMASMGGAEILPRDRGRVRTQGAFGAPKSGDSRQRLTRATGPGSINAESEMQQLIDSGQPKEAAALWEAHHRIRGASPMRWGGQWYELFKAGDPRARGVEA